MGTLGDYGNIPPSAIHTFQLVDPDTQLTHVFHPGGFEHLFDVSRLGEFETSTISSPYLAIPADEQLFGPMMPGIDDLLTELDLYATPEEVHKLVSLVTCPGRPCRSLCYNVRNHSIFTLSDPAPQCKLPASLGDL